MPKHVKLSPKMVRDLARLGEKTGLDRSSLIRLAVAHLIDDEKKRMKQEPR